MSIPDWATDNSELILILYSFYIVKLQRAKSIFPREYEDHGFSIAGGRKMKLLL